MTRPTRRSTEVLRDYMAVSGESVLDVGCGSGALVGWLRKHGSYAIGLDPQVRLLEAPAVAGLGDALPFAAKSFDRVIFFNSLHHVPVSGMAMALEEAARVAIKAVLVVEPIAEGSHFEMVQPIDDETDIRAAAYRALRNAPSLQVLDETEWQLDYVERDLLELIDGMIRVDPSREDKIAAQRVELERRFFRYGRKVDNGYAFDQPMRLSLLTPV